MSAVLIWPVFASVARALFSNSLVVGKHAQDSLVRPLVHTSRLDRHGIVSAPIPGWPNSRIASSRRKGRCNRLQCSTHGSNLRRDLSVSCRRHSATRAACDLSAPVPVEHALAKGRGIEVDTKKYLAEAIGTLANAGRLRERGYRLRLSGGWHRTSRVAFGLRVLTMAYAIGHVSGCHLNPAVTVGLAAGGRFPASQIGPYVVAQIVGPVVGATVLYLIASGAPGFDAAKGFAANGYGAHSPGHYSLFSCFVTEVIMTMMFLFIIMGSTHGKAPVGFAALISIPVTNTSVNPARSYRPRAFRGRLGYRPALAVHSGPAGGRCLGRNPLPLG
jgi:aquaporin Z